MAKRIVLIVTKVIAGIAAVVFWVMPFRTSTQFLLFAGSLAVMVICAALITSLDEKNGEETTGYWPRRTKL